MTSLLPLKFWLIVTIATLGALAFEAHQPATVRAAKALSCDSALATVRLPSGSIVDCDTTTSASAGIGSTAPRIADDQLLDAALTLFVEAGLELPAGLTVDFPVEQAACFGYGGVYMPNPNEVRICRPSDSTMVHELAHAWIETTLSDDERRAFMEFRGLTTWTGGSAWAERGAEHAAEVLTWALLERDTLVRWLEPQPDGGYVETFRLFKIDNSTRDELVTAYNVLTGLDLADREPKVSTAETGLHELSIEARRAGVTPTRLGVTGVRAG